jgi:hypothetical protein
MDRQEEGFHVVQWPGNEHEYPLGAWISPGEELRPRSGILDSVNLRLTLISNVPNGHGIRNSVR